MKSVGELSKPAERVTVTIPADLHERLEKVRDKFNVSKICYDALSLEVSFQETLIQPIDRMDQLRKQREIYLEKQAVLAKEHALEDSKTMSYKELKVISDFWICDSDSPDSPVNPDLFEILPEFIIDVLLRYNRKSTDEGYLENYLSSVNDYFLEIENKLSKQPN